eukprot:s3670_g3.t1
MKVYIVKYLVGVAHVLREEHYVCRHENCRRGAYRLVAFANEDDLWMHEIKEHSTKLSQKASKRGTRLAMGATSYREVQAEAREARRNTQRSPASLEAATGQVRFMRTRGKPPAPPESDWPKLQEESGSSGSQVDETRYPPRAVKQQERRATALGPEAPAAPAATPAASSRPPRVDPVREQHRALAQLLAVAVQRIDQTGINLVAALEHEEWRAKNRRFKRDLEEQLGPTELQRFKEFSMQYRYNLRDAETSAAGQTGSAAAATYAQRVMEVFATTMAKSGEAVAAELLCDLVLLLPDEAPRHLLYQALDDLSRTEAAAAAPPAPPAAPKPTAPKAPKAAPAKASAPKAAPKAPVLSPQLEETLEAVPMSRSCRGGRLSFLSALNAVMEVMSSPTSPPVPLQALRRCVKQLDGQQAESLELMHQHLVDAGGSTLDFEPMDRLLSLRPLLQLKLGSASSSGADRDRSWWEWKEAAAAAVQRMGVEERKAVRLYVSLASKHLEESGAGYPAKAPPLAPAWEKSSSKGFLRTDVLRSSPTIATRISPRCRRDNVEAAVSRSRPRLRLRRTPRHKVSGGGSVVPSSGGMPWCERCRHEKAEMTWQGVVWTAPMRRTWRAAVFLSFLTLVLAGKKVSVKEVVFDSAVSDIQWLGEDQKTVITQTAKGRLYRSTNGGETWNDITDFFKVDVPGSSPQPFVAESMTKSPADSNTILAPRTLCRCAFQ